MGWTYLDYRAYGIMCAVYSAELKAALAEHAHVLGYDAYAAPHMFVYVKSTYQVLNEDEGSYAFSSPDARGSAFTAPTHPTIHTVESLPAPKCTDAENAALEHIRSICRDHNQSGDLAALWLRDARIEY